MKFQIKIQSIPQWGTEASINGPIPNAPEASCQLASCVVYNGETKESYNLKLAAMCREYAAIYIAASDFLCLPNPSNQGGGK